ncbi:MAG: tetraacyldisaccharide 4'-kinase [Deltaproteobacteria bacterium]|jgi:tetraacyldisaccharide 4'-kinase|nr:tetraacyldisaccharide 4'-kinase [Deltaproteobacteria bacterium]
MNLDDFYSREKEPAFPLRKISSLWGLVLEKRRKMYRKGSFASKKAPVPVISVGNLTMGGNGKTPMCVFLANSLMEKGYNPAIISRGYGRTSQSAHPDPVLISAGDGPLLPWQLSGDEPALMAGLTRAIVFVSKERSLAAIEAARIGADVLILDDGYQHLAIKRDANILMLQAENFLGNGKVFPAGPLRERPSSHEDADIIVAVGARIHPALERLAGTRPLFLAHNKPLRLTDPRQQKSWDFDALRGKRFAAFCGLASPLNFKKTLKALNLEPVAFRAFSDHAPYKPQDKEFLKRLCDFTHSLCLVTTAKDYIKLKDLQVPLLILESALELEDSQGFLEVILKKIYREAELDA